MHIHTPSKASDSFIHSFIHHSELEQHRSSAVSAQSTGPLQSQCKKKQKYNKKKQKYNKKT